MQQQPPPPEEALPTDVATIFSQEPTHEAEARDGAESLSASDMDLKRAEITRTFFQTFFEYPIGAGGTQQQQQQVAVDLVDFLYESLVPARYRQRKQERAKYRLNELRDAFHRATTTTTTTAPPPSPADPLLSLPPHLLQLHRQHQQHQHQQATAAAANASMPFGGVEASFPLSLPPPPEQQQQQHQQHQQQHHQHQHQQQQHHHAPTGVAGDAAGPTEQQLVLGAHFPTTAAAAAGGGGTKRKQVFDKKAWTKRQSNRTYWLGMRGPLFPARMPLLRKLESLLGHPLSHLSEHTFRLAWEREQVRRTHSLSSSPSPSSTATATATAATSAPPHSYAPSSASPSDSASAASSSAGGMPPAKQPRLGPGPADGGDGGGGGVASSPLQSEDPAHAVLPTFPLYDVWRDADQDTRPPTGSFVHFVFDVPGVEEEPKFTFSKATRRWRLEGYRAETYVSSYRVQQRWQGKFCVQGTFPPSVDVSAVPTTAFASGLYHVLLAEFVD